VEGGKFFELPFGATGYLNVIHAAIVT
jgi:hypothetical protein